MSKSHPRVSADDWGKTRFLRCSRTSEWLENYQNGHRSNPCARPRATYRARKVLHRRVLKQSPSSSPARQQFRMRGACSPGAPKANSGKVAADRCPRCITQRDLRVPCWHSQMHNAFRRALPRLMPMRFGRRPGQHWLARSQRAPSGHRESVPHLAGPAVVSHPSP